MMGKTIILQPRLTEKTYGLSSDENAVYVFDVATDLNKHTIKRAVEEQFEVTVKNVNILNNKGKAKRTIAQKGRKVYQGKQNRIKKAYVTLNAGQNLPFFEAIEEEEKKQEATQAKMEKAMDKQEAKEAKKASKTNKSSAAESKDESTDIQSTKTISKDPTKSRRRLHLRGRRGKQEDK